jgi:hypothetical protein
MDNETAYRPKETREYWNKPGPRSGQALEPLWEFHRRTEDRLRGRISKKHPDMAYEEVEAVVAMKMLEMFESQPEKLFANIPTASAETLAGDLNPQLLGSMVKWRI